MTPRVELLSPSSLPIAVRAGLGAALLPDDLGRQIAGIVRIPVDAPPPDPVELWLVAHRDIRELPRVAVVWDWLVALFTG